MTLASSTPKLVNVGRQYLDADALDAPAGIRLQGLPPGPLSALVRVIAGTIRLDPADGLVTPDFGGFLAPAGTVFDVPNARDLRMVAATSGAEVDVILLGPA